MSISLIAGEIVAVTLESFSSSMCCSRLKVATTFTEHSIKVGSLLNIMSIYFITAHVCRVLKWIWQNLRSTENVSMTGRNGERML